MLRSIIGLFALCLLSFASLADEKDKTISQQKTRAKANWEKLELAPPTVHETTHFIVLAPDKLKAKSEKIGPYLEKHYETAEKVLFTEKDDRWSGKLTVYLFDEPLNFDSFIRRIEKRRLEGREVGTGSVETETLYVAACSPRSDDDVPIERQAAYQVARAMLMQKAGARTNLPTWLNEGFARATHLRTAGAGSERTKADRKAAVSHYRRGKSARHVWGDEVEGQAKDILSGSVADFLAYGPGRKKFIDILNGFKPGEGRDTKTFDQAVRAAGLQSDLLDKTWQRWVFSPR